MKIYNLADKLEYLDEICRLTEEEWGKYKDLDEFELKISRKKQKIKSLFSENNYCKLILLDGDSLVGFISIFPKDGDERSDLSPWYATMYVKKEYRGKGYSKILNDAILDEARNRGFSKIYLKSELKNYYEKFGAIYMEDLKNGEKLYYIGLKK